MFKPITFIISILILCSCKMEVKFKDGDILFRGKQNGSLSSAIDEVTQTNRNTHYTHMGVVEVNKHRIKVWHADPDKGVTCDYLEDFCWPDPNDTMVIGHYRIKKISKKEIDRALEEAQKLEGQPYDFTYVFDNKGYYCSEFVYEIFLHEKVFALEPMTFIDPSTGQFHDGWVKYYQDLGMEIPEGQPGCNPNKMADSPNIEFLNYFEKQ